MWPQRLRVRVPPVAPNFGPVAQLGERLHGMQEVAGSIPARSTKVRVCSSIERAPALQAGGSRFESDQIHQCSPEGPVGSDGALAREAAARVPTSDGANPSRRHHPHSSREPNSLARSSTVERPAVNREVAGSNPAGSANFRGGTLRVSWRDSKSRRSGSTPGRRAIRPSSSVD